MPQDSLKSAMYRSFVTCDDPKGVIEGKTIKKSKGMDSKAAKQASSNKDIAKDLLRGALDLQESLVMLEKLHEASEYMTSLRKKAKDNAGRREFDGKVGIERTKSERFTGHSYNNKVEFEKSRMSVDGASRDCYDELRDVIRESLARQNLLPPSEKACFDRREVKFSPDFPSTSFTSSNDSSIEKLCVADRKFVTPPDFSSSMVRKEKPKGPNLIARLMGLEEIPSTPLHPTTPKQMEKDKIFKQRRPIFEIDLPMAKKQPFIVHKVDPKQRTLDGIIESMQFKGLLRNKLSEQSNRTAHQSSVYGKLRSFADDAPPIVIMKPIYAPEMEVERFPTCIHDENPPGSKDMFGKKNSKKEDSAVNFTIYQRMHTRKVHNTSFVQEKRTKDRGEATAGPRTNEVAIQRKLPTPKNRAPSPEKTKQLKKEAIEKRVEGTHRSPGIKKSKETKSANFNDTSNHQDQSKMTTGKVRKPERKLNTSEKIVAPPNSMISKRTTPITSHNSRNKKKIVKTDKPVKSSTIVPMVEEMEHKDEKIQIVQTVEQDSDTTITKVTSSEELPFEQVTEIFEVSTDNLTDGDSSAAELLEPSIQCDQDIQLMEHASYHSPIYSIKMESFKSRASTRCLLLSSESFLSKAEELFDTDAWEPTAWKTVCIDNEMDDSTLLLDCANELLESKRYLCAEEISKIPLRMSRVPISFDELVSEICDGIEVLKSYTKVAASTTTLSGDALYALHERDLRCKGVVSTAWHRGWRSGFTMDEVEQVVNDIENHLLSGIFSDVLTEFIL